MQLGLTGTLSPTARRTRLSPLTKYALLSGGATTPKLSAPIANIAEALISNGTTAQPG